ncbi:uncharacterized protein SPPG_04278 [Spizellomyces punctatus DAOM BR117]|uniref:WW domain-containing protein n=1 Tax=Spizellomyces punctatus (strain DAOM BR117) TaxID=645134 RepID=A0A0L0HJJ1_SPIPD|nr:uncharacterized protein SPPG_04278 [Spizellomyces punctatus DAOM BR117]KND01188.1 hypothetical protein SPPG_04278 [Spizellomyces punctatus DAOM BR117]|eukprot:XP_016609227.1 hypothetical protein SPPG_04278 [Spizellomyces punctatus DAOM BR117]
MWSMSLCRNRVGGTDLWLSSFTERYSWRGYEERPTKDNNRGTRLIELCCDSIHRTGQAAEKPGDMDAVFADFISEINAMSDPFTQTLSEATSIGSSSGISSHTKSASGPATSVKPKESRSPDRPLVALSSLPPKFATALIKPSRSSPLHRRTNTLLSKIANLLALGPDMLPVELENVTACQKELTSRFLDWTRGALHSGYFEEILKHWEVEVVPAVENRVAPHGWSLEWDARSEAYSFKCAETDDIRWSHPLKKEMAEISTPVPPPLPPPPPPPPPPPQPEDEQQNRKEVHMANSAHPSKKVTTLFQKWKAAGAELMKDTDETTAPEDLNNWAKRQMQKDAVAFNPNFTPVQPRTRR